MSLFDQCSPEWGPGFLFQANGDSPVIGYTEDFMCAYPMALINAGFSCDDAFGVFADLYLNRAFTGVVKDGATIPVVGPDMFQGARGNTGFVIVDGQEVGQYSYTLDGWEYTAGSYTAKSGFQDNFLITQAVVNGQVGFNIPVSNMLKRFDFLKWWCLVTEGANCCPETRPILAGFRIPYGSPDAPRAVGDENLSVPPIGQPLALSNFSSQYVRGMVNKPVKF